LTLGELYERRAVQITKFWYVSLIPVLFFAAAPKQAFSAQSRELGEFGPWAALQEGSGPKTVCYVYAEPLRRKGRYTKRGDAFVQVVHAPAEKVANEVLFVAGYTYKKNSSVTVNIDGRQFVLVTDKDAAWPHARQQDFRLVDAMKKGSRMVVRGRSWRGTLTTDTYSLMGFTAAHNAASAACNMRLR